MCIYIYIYIYYGFVRTIQPLVSARQPGGVAVPTGFPSASVRWSQASQQSWVKGFRVGNQSSHILAAGRMFHRVEIMVLRSS